MGLKLLIISIHLYALFSKENLPNPLKAHINKDKVSLAITIIYVIPVSINHQQLFQVSKQLNRLMNILRSKSAKLIMIVVKLDPKPKSPHAARFMLWALSQIISHTTNHATIMKDNDPP